MAAPSTWNDIPDVALIDIYLHMKDDDKFSMSCVCKNWKRLFETPALWRERRVMFNSLYAEKTCENETKFIDRFGHCLNKLTLGFGSPTFKSCMVISKAADCYLKRIHCRNDIHLKELDIEQLRMEQYWHFILSRNRLVTSLCKMLRKQRFLESVYVSSARMRLFDACRLLEALAKGPSGGSIKTLFMEDLFETNVFPFRNRRYINAMSKFRALENLHLNYKYLNHEVLQNLGLRLSRSLESLSIIMEGDLRGIEIPSEHWQTLKERCPKFKASAYLCTSIFRGNDLRPPFVRGIPLTELYLTTWMRIDDTEQRLAGLLQHIGNTYSRTLENFAMFFERHQPIDAELMSMISRCTRLDDVCLTCRLSAQTVLDICRLHHDGRISLSCINLTIRGLSDDDWQTINAQKSRLLADIIEHAYIGPNDFTSSSIGSTTASSSTDNEIDDDDDDSQDDDIFHHEANPAADIPEAVDDDEENPEPEFRPEYGPDFGPDNDHDGGGFLM